MRLEVRGEADSHGDAGALHNLPEASEKVVDFIADPLKDCSTFLAHVWGAECRRRVP